MTFRLLHIFIAVLLMAGFVNSEKIDLLELVRLPLGQRIQRLNANKQPTREFVGGVNDSGNGGFRNPSSSGFRSGRSVPNGFTIFPSIRDKRSWLPLIQHIQHQHIDIFPKLFDEKF